MLKAVNIKEMNQHNIDSLKSYSTEAIDLSDVTLPEQLIVPKLTTKQKDVINLQFNIQDGKITVFHSDHTTKRYGWDNFVITCEGALKIGKRHYALGNERGVWGAGSLMHLDGKVLALTNNSAHYKPTFEEAQKAYKYLQQKLGLNLSNTLDHSFHHNSPEDFLQKENVLRRFWMQQLIDWNKIYKVSK